MKMVLNMQQRMEMECTICKQPFSEHDPSCPQKRCADLSLERSLNLLVCSKCHKQSVLPNSDDFLECDKCHALFTTGCIAAMGHDPDTLERTVLFSRVKDGGMTQALVIPEKGKGDIPINHRLDVLVKEREEAREKALREQEKE